MRGISIAGVVLSMALAAYAQTQSLKFHRETRDLTVNLLDIDKNGPKLKPSADGISTNMRMNQGPGKSQLTGTVPVHCTEGAIGVAAVFGTGTCGDDCDRQR
jgi:uncharacterized protein (TIGR03435 family)